MPSEFLFNHRFVYQNEVQGDNEPPKAEKADKRLEAPATIEGSKEFADQQVDKTEKDGGVALENNKFGDNVPNPEFLTPEKLAKYAKEQPQNILLNPQLKKHPEYANLIDVVARAAVDKCPSVLLSPLVPKNLPNYPKLRGEALEKLATRDPRRVVEEPAQPGDSPQTRALAQANLSRFNHYA